MIKNIVSNQIFMKIGIFLALSFFIIIGYLVSTYLFDLSIFSERIFDFFLSRFSYNLAYLASFRPK